MDGIVVNEVSRYVSSCKGSTKQIWDYLGVFPNIEGGGLLNPKTVVILTITLKPPEITLKLLKSFKHDQQILVKKVKIPQQGGGGSKWSRIFLVFP